MMIMKFPTEWTNTIHGPNHQPATIESPMVNPSDLDVQLPRQRNQLPIPKLGLKRVWRVLGSVGRDDNHVDGLFLWPCL
jgi:hypothetical protein